MDNFEQEVFDMKEARDKRWEELMLVKPHVVKDTTSEMVTLAEGPENVVCAGRIKWRVRYPRLVL